MKGITENEKMALGTLENPEMAPSCTIGIPKPPEEGSTPAHNVTASRTPRNAKEKKALSAMRRMSNLENRRMSMIEEQREEDAEEEGEEGVIVKLLPRVPLSVIRLPQFHSVIMGCDFIYYFHIWNHLQDSTRLVEDGGGRS